MKKTLLSLAAVAITLSASAEKTLWTMSDIKEANPAVNTATTYTYNGLTFYGDPKSDYAAGATVNVENYSFSFDARIKLGGASVFQSNKTMSRVFEFEADANEPILVFFTHGSSSGDPRGTYLSNAATTTKNDTSTAFAKLAADAGSKACLSGVNPTTGKVYVWCDNNNAIYAIAKGYTLEELNDFMNGSSEDPAEGETFAMKGNGAATYGQSFDEIVTPFEFDKANKTVTLSDFLGSKANIVIKFEQADPNKDPDMTGTVFNSVAVSGLGEGDANTGCAIENFTGSVIIKKDGANFGKLENVTFLPGFNSQLVVDTKSINGTNQKVYNLTLMIGGDFYKWDAATSAWGEKEKYPEFFKLEKDIPFVSDDQSGIDSIVTDSADENAPVEYYNLQGIRLSEPAAGQIVIRRQGSKVSKIVVR